MSKQNARQLDVFADTAPSLLYLAIRAPGGPTKDWPIKNNLMSDLTSLLPEDLALSYGSTAGVWALQPTLGSDLSASAPFSSVDSKKAHVGDP